MDLKKELSAIGIEEIRKLDYIETNTVIMNFVETLMNTFPSQNINAEQAVLKLYSCKMCFADFPRNLGTANYFYKNKTIYFKQGTDITSLDKYMAHELIHFFQDVRDKKDNLNKMGICHFGDLKVHGMAMNEAAIEYVTSKMLESHEEEVSYCDIILKTTSKNYYPLLSNLIKQIVYLVGDEKLVKSTLFSTEDFLDSLMDIIGETNTKEIQNGFDLLLDAKQQLFKIRECEDRIKHEKLIKELYENLQNQILTSYYDGMLSLIEKVEEVEPYRDKLEGYRTVLGNVDNFEFFEDYKEKQIKKLDQKILEITTKNSRNMLATISNNKIFAFFRMIRRFFYSQKKENRN